MKKAKKSIFAGIFSTNLIIIIVSVLLIAVMQSVLISQFVHKERLTALEDNAKKIAAFIEKGTAPEHLTNFLYGFSHSTKTNILIVDKDGDILLASTSDKLYNKDVKSVEKKYMKDVLNNNNKIVKGTLGDIFRTKMFTLQVPIAISPSKEVVGAIFISTPTPEMAKTQIHLYRILGLSLFLVILVSVGLSVALSRRISKPIKKIGETAKQFARGDFSNRVQLDMRAENITEISELTENFNNMAYSLEKSDDIRNNFLSDVAHELRTPMTTISGFVDGILDGTIPKERQNDYLSIVRDEVGRLSGLVNSFLKLTRVEAGNQELEVTNFDICEILRRTLFGFEAKIEEKKINIQFDIPDESCMVKADMNLIRQVVTNLIENAIKFTGIGGLLKLSVRQARSEAEISVYNTGCGISDEDKKLIFERFYKADKSRSLNREGIGIGLYIVKDILKRHGKSITVESREGEFAEFSFTLDKA